jgi:hypothetical protein
LIGREPEAYLVHTALDQLVSDSLLGNRENLGGLVARQLSRSCQGRLDHSDRPGQHGSSGDGTVDYVTVMEEVGAAYPAASSSRGAGTSGNRTHRRSRC